MAHDIERLFRTWVELSRDRELVALMALIEHDLRRRGYSVSVEIGRDTDTTRSAAS